MRMPERTALSGRTATASPAFTAAPTAVECQLTNSTRKAQEQYLATLQNIFDHFWGATPRPGLTGGRGGS